MKKYLALTLAFVILFTGTFVFAEGNVSVKTQPTRSELKGATSLDMTVIACIKTAITKREDTLSTGYSTYSINIASSYSARKVALLAAWDSSDAKTRRSAVRSADLAFKSSVLSAKKAWNGTRRTTWSVFESERKACSPGLSAIDTGSSQSDGSI